MLEPRTCRSHARRWLRGRGEAPGRPASIHRSRAQLAAAGIALLILAASGAAAAPFELRWHGYLAKPPSWRCADGSVPEGLSGLEHLGGDDYVAISDARNPARAYRLRIVLGPSGIEEVDCLEAVELSSGDSGIDEEEIAPEAIRRDPSSGNWLWASERDARFGVEIYETDFVLGVTRRILGQALREPAKFIPRYDRKTREQVHGAEPNGGIEGLAVSPDQAIFAAFEAPLAQDVAPDAAERPIRLLRLAPDRLSVSEFVYRAPAELRISEMASLDASVAPRPERQFLVLERVYLPARGQTRAQLALADLSHLDLVRDDVSGEVTLPPDAPAASRTKLLDFDDFTDRMVNERGDLDCNVTFLSGGGRRVGNIEGMTLGPSLGNGSRALLLVSANERPHHCTQFIVLRLAPR